MVENRRAIARTGIKRTPHWMTVIFSLLATLLLLFVLLPVVATFLGTSPEALIDTLSQQDVLQSVALTFYAALLATLFALFTGVPLAYMLARGQFPGKRLVEAIVDLPVVIPHTAAGVALLMVFGGHGLVGQRFSTMGIYFTENLVGIVIAMLFVSLPFLVDTARESFALVDPRLERVARTLGASPWQAFRRVTLPLAWPGVLAGALLMWARGISEFGAVVLLAYNPKIIPVLIFERFTGFGLAAALPVALLLIVISLVVFVVLRTLLLRHGPAGGRR
jgi:molybdate/tungstate transport system permease protein